MFDENIVKNILVYVGEYKNIRLVCKSWYMIIENMFPGGGKFINHLMALIKIFPDAEWYNPTLKHNPSLTEEGFKIRNIKTIEYENCRYYHHHMHTKEITNEMIANHSNIESLVGFCFAKLSVNTNVCKNFDVVINNIERPWNFESLSKNVTWDIIEKYPMLHWNFYQLSKNKKICNSKESFKRLKKYLHHPWDFEFISYCKYITWEDVIKNPQIHWDYDRLSYYMPWYVITSFISPELWNLELLSSNSNVTFEIIKTNPNINWDPYGVSRNKNITLDIILRNLDFPWNIEGLFLNKNITINDIFKYPGIFKADYDITYNLVKKGLTVDLLVKNFNSPIFRNKHNWKRLSKYLNMNDIFAHLSEYPWDYDSFNYNLTLTWKIVYDNPNIPWDFKKMSVNKFY